MLVVAFVFVLYWVLLPVLRSENAPFAATRSRACGLEGAGVVAARDARSVHLLSRQYSWEE